MLITTFICISVVMGLFMTFIWSTKGFLNTSIKVFFALYTFFGFLLLINIFGPILQANGMKLF